MNKKKKIVLIGCVHSTKAAFDFLINMESSYFEFSGVVSKSQSNINADFFNIANLSKKKKIPLFLYDSTKDSNNMSKWLEDIKPDLIFVIGWSHIISKKVLSIPSISIIGFHPSELPMNRGRHPIIWSLVLGLKQTASSFFLMEGEVDKGPIVNQKKIKISINDNAESLYKKINQAIPIQLNQILRRIKNKSLIAHKQNDGQSNLWRKRTASDGEIDWRMSSSSIYNLIRALSSPYSGAFFKDNSGKEIKVFKSTIYLGIIANNLEPGKILKSNPNELLVKTSDGAILLRDLSSKPLLDNGDCI
ncbi:formyltransferase family protein [Gammaproteobacteria bacterium]|nr:formyltransferase family protein [Gammaproteobacteria bacterium]